MSQEVNVKAKLGVDTIKVDTNKHITVKNEICKGCTEKVCLHVCPAQVYKINSEGDIVLDLEGCLECGTCVIACEKCAIDWNYPAGGFGIQLKFG
jgi:ferredoxin like protein